MRSLGFLLRLVTAVVLCSVLVSATDYQRNSEIPLYANKIGPYHNPSEQYEYYTIPICEPKDEERKWHNLGEAIGGDRLVKTRASRVALALPVPMPFHACCRLQDPVQERNGQATSVRHDAEAGRGGHAEGGHQTGLLL